MTTNELRTTLPQVGNLEWIGVSSGHRSAIVELDQVEVTAGKGLTSDYHAKSGDSDRQVTLIQHEHLAVLRTFLDRDDIAPAMLRRNLAVSGINLRALQKLRFSIGSVVLEGTGDCAPCSRMEEALGPGGYTSMIGHGGITARVLTGGVIQRGDEVRFVPAKP